MSGILENAIKQQVASSRPEDAGRGLARVGQRALDELGVQPGQAIEIVCKRHTVAIAAPPYPEDEGLNVIRLDGLQRKNAGATSGDVVEIRRVDVRAATKVVVAPAAFTARARRCGGRSTAVYSLRATSWPQRRRSVGPR